MDATKAEPDSREPFALDRLKGIRSAVQVHLGQPNPGQRFEELPFRADSGHSRMGLAFGAVLA